MTGGIVAPDRKLSCCVSTEQQPGVPSRAHHSCLLCMSLSCTMSVLRTSLLFALPDPMATIGEDDEPDHVRVSAAGGAAGGAGTKDGFIEAEEVDFDSTRGSM